MSDASVHIKFDINGNIYKDNEIVGITGANLTGTLLFTFLESDLYATPDFVKNGNAILEYSRLTDTETLETGFIPLGTVRREDTGEQIGFAIEIKSSLLKYKGNLNLQLHITNQVDGRDNIQVYKSKIFNLYVAESINATKEIPEDYPNWIDEINVRLQEMDNLDIKAERVSNGVEVISTSKTGVESRYLVHDGEKGEQGERGLQGFKGDKGADGAIQYEAGENITIENNVISASGYKLPIASADTLGGIKLGKNLSIDENGVVSAQGGETIPYTYAEYGFFSGANRQITDTVFIANVENIITTYLNKSKTVKRIGAFTDSQSNDTSPVYMTYSCYSKITTSKTSFTFYGDTSSFMDYNSKYQVAGSVITVSGTWNDNQFHITACNIKGVPNGTVIATSSTALLKNNTTSFTPTGDYNPSTKLYTDKTHYENMVGYDATKTQTLKNINGVLTWVSDTESGA